MNFYLAEMCIIHGKSKVFTISYRLAKAKAIASYSYLKSKQKDPYPLYTMQLAKDPPSTNLLSTCRSSYIDQRRASEKTVTEG